jgi:hypothetical protein
VKRPRPDLTRFFTALDALARPGAGGASDDAEFLYAPGTASGALRRRNLEHYLNLMGEVGPR